MSNDVEWPDHPVKLTATEYASFVKKYPAVIVDFWASWCGPCKNLGPVLEALAADYKGKVAVGKVNTDENQELSIDNGIQYLPTLVLFKNGKEVERFSGFRPRPELEAKFKALL